MELGLLYYLFSAHNWALKDLRDLREGTTGWHDLIYALASYEANKRAERAKEIADRPKVKVIKSMWKR